MMFSNRNYGEHSIKMKLGSSIFSLFLTLFIVVSFGEATIQGELFS